MADFYSKADPITKQIMYGAQKQANRINDATVLFVEDMLNKENNFAMPIMDENEQASDQAWVDAKVSAIIAQLEGYVGLVVGYEEQFFIDLFLSKQEQAKITEGCTFRADCISDTGKYVFYTVAAGASTSYEDHPGPEGDTAVEIERERKTMSKDEEALQLIEKILKDCPNRAEYPEDDALAAIMYGEVYWKKGGVQ